MSYSNQFTWNIAPQGQPKVVKHCSKCGQDSTFTNSGKFRVNANKKHLDIWLIYHCESCKSTYNLTVFERIRPQDLSNELLESYMKNDGDLAHAVGFDMALHMRNKVTLDMTEVPIEITGQVPSFDEKAIIEIHCFHPMGLRADKVLSQKLGVSRALLKKQIKAGVIREAEGADLLKLKLKDKVRIIIN